MKSKCYLIMLVVCMQFHVSNSQGLDASPQGIMISHGHPKGGWMISYNFMSMTMKNNLSGTQNITDEKIFVDYLMSPVKMRMDMHMMMAMYGLTGRLSFMIMGSYNIQKMDMNMLPGTMHMHGSTMEMDSNSTSMSTNSSGFGDTKLWALYKLFNGKGSSLVLSLGINFPTGKIDITGADSSMYNGQRLPYMMQTGTGSFDLMPGLTYLKTHNKITYSVQLLSTIRPFDNNSGYHYGNELTLNVWGAYQLQKFMSFSLRGELFSSGKISGSDNSIYAYMEPAANPLNYGGTRVSGFAGLNFYINKGALRDTKFGVESGIPLYQNVNGIQTGNLFYVNAGLTKSF